MSSILSARGSRVVELGGEHSWLQRSKGDIVANYQWLDIGNREPEACLVLFPQTLKLEGGAYVIPQGNAHEFCTNKGDPTPHLLTAAYNAAVTMGFFPDQSTVFRIIDIIAEGLPDLVRMPSEQPRALDLKRQVVGIEASARVGGQTFHEEVI